MPDMLSLIVLEWPLGCRVIKVSDETACKRQKKLRITGIPVIRSF